MVVEVLPVAFYFQVYIGGESVSFKEVSGLNAEMETETITEGGNNNYQYQLPKQIKHGNLVFKRAQLPKNSPIVSWIKNILEGDFGQPIQAKKIMIHLLNEHGNPIYTWACDKAFPVKWEVESLDSTKNEVLIESVEFAYSLLKRQ